MEKDGYRDYEAAFDVSVQPEGARPPGRPAGAGIITVSSPAAGAIQETGQSLPIRWSVDYQALAAAKPEFGALGLPNVRIELWKNGAKTADIAASVPNNGAYDWTVPAGQATGEGYVVRIVCPSDATISGDSPAFIIATRTTRLYEGNNPPDESFNFTCSFDAPIDVPDEGKIVAFRHRVSCYNETGVSITMIAPDGTRLTNPGYTPERPAPGGSPEFKETSVFDGHWMRGVWKLEVRDTLTPPERDDITHWFGWAIEITYLAW